MYPAKDQDYIAFEDRLLLTGQKDRKKFIERLAGFISRNRRLLIPPERLQESYESLRETELEITEEFYPAEEETFSLYEQYLLSLDNLKGADVSLEKHDRYAKEL